MSLDFEKLFKTYYMQVYSFVMTLSRNQDISEEIAQKTFFKAMATSKKHQGHSSEFTWLCAIAKNLYIDELRKHKTIQELDSEVISDVDLEHSLVNEDSAFLIHQVVHNLEEPYKEVYTYDNRLQKETKHVVERYTNKVKRKSLSIGLGIGSILLIPILVCLIVNLATGHALDWFFIVFTSLMLFASITVVPLVVEKRKALWTLGSFTASLMLLLLSCCLYSNSNWFFVAAISILFGLSIVFLPYIVYQLPLNGFFSKNKGLLVMTVDTLLFYLLIFTCGVYANSAAYWNTAFSIATVSGLFPWIVFFIIRYFHVNPFIKSGLCVITSGIFIALLNDVIHWILEGVFHISLLNANLLVWNTDNLLNANLYLLSLLSTLFIGIILIIVGVIRNFTAKAKKN